jgi:hypothetical protein
MASAGFEPTCRGRMRAAEPQALPAARMEWGGRESNPQSQRRRGYNPLGSPVPVPPRENPPAGFEPAHDLGPKPSALVL